MTMGRSGNVDSAGHDVEQQLSALADRQVATNDLLVTMLNQTMDVRRVLEQVLNLQNNLLIEVQAAKAAAMDANLRSVNLSTDVEQLTSTVNALGDRLELLERTVRGLRVYKVVSPDV